MAFRWRSLGGGRGVLLAAAVAALGATHCGGGDSTDNAGGNGGKGGKGGNGGSAAGINFDSGVGGGGGTVTIDPDAACATTSQEATLTPVNMLIMFDRSGSMNQNNKWPNTTAALNAFFQDPGTAGLRIALRFFPDDQPAAGCNNQACSIPACAQVLVGLAPVTADPAPTDAQEAALVSAVSGHAPGNGGGTPMYAALAGAEQWADNLAVASPAEKVVVVLVTDGMPNGCNEDINAISQLAADALAQHAVLTYAVGLEGSATAQMNQIATAGGTSAGIFIGSGNAQAELLAALKAIQGSQVSCQFQMPQSQTGTPVDPSKVNVNYTPGGGAMQTVGQVASAAECVNGGWYYDNPTAPTTITLCPTTCATVQADKDAKIQVLLGCATQAQPPPQ